MSRETIQLIQVIHLGGLTETILALPALESLRSHFPQARITALTSPGGGELIGLSGKVDEVVAIGRWRKGEILRPGIGYRTVGGLDRLRRQAQAGRGADLVIDFDSGLTGMALRWLLKTTGRGVKATGQPTPGLHRAHHYLRQLEGLAVRPVVSHPRLRTTLESDQRIEKLLQSRGLASGQLLIGLHAGPGHGTEEAGWPLARFTALGRRLGTDFGARLLVLTGPGRRAEARQLTASLPGLPGLPGQMAVRIDPLPLRDYLSLTARLSLVVGNLGASTHLAAAVGTPVVAAALSRNPTPWDLTQPGTIIVRAPHYDLPELRDEETIYQAASRLLTQNRSTTMRNWFG